MYNFEELLYYLMIDATFIIPNNAAGIYQSLSNKFSAIETPTWALLLAQSCRSSGYKVSIIDTLAENLSDQDTLERIKTNNPKNIIFVVYGQNVNAGTTNMSGATRLSNFIKKKFKYKNILHWFSCSSSAYANS